METKFRPATHEDDFLFRNWIREFRHLANELSGFPVNDDHEAYREYFTEGTTPGEALNVEIDAFGN